MLLRNEECGVKLLVAVARISGIQPTAYLEYDRIQMQFLALPTPFYEIGMCNKHPREIFRSQISLLSRRMKKSCF